MSGAQSPTTEESEGIGFDLGKLKKLKKRELAIRFAFGAGIALAAGLIGARFGPRLGGLFLAFPAILPASLTLIEEKEGGKIAGVSAEGAVLGGVAMIAFALTVVLLLGLLGPSVLPAALVVWAILAVALYLAVRARLRQVGRYPGARGSRRRPSRA